MSRQRQVDNGSFYGKVIARQRIRAELSPGARVLEGFAGEGKIYRSCWSGMRGLCIDKDRDKVTSAARERPDWACYEADTERALLYGLGRYPWEVVDLDPYGSPWKFVKAWMTSVRPFAPLTHLILTDGYMGQMSMAGPDKLLFPDLAIKGVEDAPTTMTASFYLERVRTRLAEWGEIRGLTVQSFDTTTSRRMVIHHLRIARTAG